MSAPGKGSPIDRIQQCWCGSDDKEDDAQPVDCDQGGQEIVTQGEEMEQAGRRARNARESKYPPSLGQNRNSREIDERTEPYAGCDQ